MKQLFTTLVTVLPLIFQPKISTASELSPKSTVVVIELSRYERLNQSRELWAAWIERLKACKPSVIALPILFERPTESEGNLVQLIKDDPPVVVASVLTPLITPYFAPATSSVPFHLGFLDLETDQTKKVIGVKGWSVVNGMRMPSFAVAVAELFAGHELTDAFVKLEKSNTMVLEKTTLPSILDSSCNLKGRIVIIDTKLPFDVFETTDGNFSAVYIQARLIESLVSKYSMNPISPAKANSR